MEKPELSENFKNLIIDFTKDLSITYPEYQNLWSKWSCIETDVSVYNELFSYCMTVYPERFFDFLYQNEDIFKEDSIINTFFLPDVDFKILFNSDITDKTKKSIWKYLQLILFTIVGNMKDKANFGETTSLFEGIDENELQSKLQETMSGISDFFTNMGNAMKPDETSENSAENEEPKQTFNFEKMNGMPNMEELHGHLKGMFDGKIGSLAKEMAEEVSKELSDILGEDITDARTSGDIIKKIMKNPKKMMDLIKTVGNKLNDKMKNGEISQDEIMKEASEIMQKMKEMGGGDQFSDMMKNFAKSMGKNVKVDTNAMNNMSKQMKYKEQMRNRLNERKMTKEMQEKYLDKNKHILSTDKPNNYIYKDENEEKQEKTFIKKNQEEEDKKLISELGDITEKASNLKKNSKKKKGKK